MASLPKGADCDNEASESTRPALPSDFVELQPSETCEVEGAVNFYPATNRGMSRFVFAR